MTNPPPPFDPGAPHHVSPPPPRRGIIPLHPIDFGTLFSASFAVIKHNPKLMFGALSALPAALLLLASGVFIAVSIMQPSAIAAFLILTAPLAIVGILAGSVALQGLALANARAAILGEKQSFRVLWSHVRPAFWRLLGFTLLIGAMALGLAVVIGLFALLVYGLAAASDPAAGVIATIILMFFVFLIFVPLIIWVSTKLLFAPSMIVFEGAEPTAALARSWRLTRGRFWVALGITAIIGAMSALVGFIADLPGTLLSMFAPLAMSSDPAAASATEIDEIGGGTFIALMVLTAVLQVLPTFVQLFSSALTTSASSIVYVDARMRTDGLAQSLQWYAAQREAGVPADQLPDPFAPAATSPAQTAPAQFPAPPA